jgi:hypothetical protein
MFRGYDALFTVIKKQTDGATEFLNSYRRYERLSARLKQTDGATEFLNSYRRYERLSARLKPTVYKKPPHKYRQLFIISVLIISQ